MDPVEAIRRCHGVAGQAALLRQGVRRRALERAVRDGDVVRHRRGYTLPGAPPELTAAAREGGTVGCISALRLLGVPMIAVPGPPHLLLASARPTRGVVVHRSAEVSGVEDLLPAVGRALRCLERYDALVVADAVLRMGIDHDLLASVVGRRPGREVSWVLRHADASAESPLESLLRAILLDERVPGLVPQPWVADVGRVDFLVDDWLILEADGYASHGTPDGFQRDRRRDVAAARQGLLTLRFTHRDLTRDRPTVAAAIRDVALRRHRRVFRLR